MPDRDPSRTAMSTAFVRAAHQVLDAPPRILEDPLAVTLLGPSGVKRIYDTADSYRPLGAGAARPRRAEIPVRRGPARRLPSAGSGVRDPRAGFDTFSVRMRDWRAACIVEIITRRRRR